MGFGRYAVSCREDVLRRAVKMLSGTHIYVTEDFSRKIVRHRSELVKYARQVN